MCLSDWLYAVTGRTHGSALKRLFELLYDGLAAQPGGDSGGISRWLMRDYQRSGLKGSPLFGKGDYARKQIVDSAANRRQQRH